MIIASIGYIELHHQTRATERVFYASQKQILQFLTFPPLLLSLQILPHKML
jgi:hypothetical protein